MSDLRKYKVKLTNAMGIHLELNPNCDCENASTEPCKTIVEGYNLIDYMTVESDIVNFNNKNRIVISYGFYDEKGRCMYATCEHNQVEKYFEILEEID